MSSVKSQSAAAFFAEHKQIAGFENDGKSMYVTVREFVENGLDAAEDISALPEIHVSLLQISRDRFHRKVGLVSSPSASTSMPPQQQQQSGKEIYKVKVRDNGKGMPEKDIPDMLGRVLSGTKYAVQQTRGKFGLGAKMVLIWAKQCTGLPIKIRTSQDGKTVSICKLDIDLQRNQPKVVYQQTITEAEFFRQPRSPSKFFQRGTEISVYIHGAWTSHGRYIRQYMALMAIITPYANFYFEYLAADEHLAAAGPAAGVSKTYAVQYHRRTDVMPAQPKAIELHPSAANLTVMERLMSERPPRMTLKQFLMRSLSSVSSSAADDILSEGALNVGPSAHLETIAHDKNLLRRLVDALHSRKFPAPDSKCLSPVGEYNLYLGILKEVSPDMVATATSSPGVHEGHPFIVEAGICVGGAKLKDGLNIFRFANKIPLLMDAGSDVITRVAKDFKWTAYHLNPKQERIGVFASVVSTRVPYKGTGKETISADVIPLSECIADCIRQCCLKLKKKIASGKQEADLRNRRKGFSKYVPNIVQSIAAVLKNSETDQSISEAMDRKRQRPDDAPVVVVAAVAAAAAASTASPAIDMLHRGRVSKLPKWEPEQLQLADSFRSGKVTQNDLQLKLLEHVNKISSDAAVALFGADEKSVKETHDFVLAERRLPERPEDARFLQFPFGAIVLPPAS